MLQGVLRDYRARRHDHCAGPPPERLIDEARPLGLFSRKSEE